MKSLHLLYHELRPVGSRYSYVISCEEFALHCALFSQLQQGSPEGVLRPELTFDDGNASDAEYAAPLLEEFRLKATFFITAGWTQSRAGFMSWTQLRTLAAAGHRIGAHGMTHQLLTSCTPSELQQELRGARQRLEDGLGSAVTSMSLPGGRANARVYGACTAAGYEQVFTSTPRAEEMAAGPKRIGRLNLHAGTSTSWLEAVLKPETGALARLQRTDRIKSLAKGVLGDSVYNRVWALANRQEPEPDTGAPAQ